MMLSLCREYNFHLHIVHLSTSRALPALRAARGRGLPVTVETCPHYLHLAAETIADGATLSKCAPPIRGRQNREELWEGLRDGTIDLVVTDHSPCLPAMKRISEEKLQRSVGRHCQLVIALPLHVDGSHEARLHVTRFGALDGREAVPAGGLRFAQGSNRQPDPTLTSLSLIPEREFVVAKESLYYRHPVSPYLGGNPARS